MKVQRKIFQTLFLLGVICIITLTVSSQPLFSIAQAQENTLPPDELSDIPDQPFQLPFADEPGPQTWLMAQPYGNTIGAYFQRFSTYGASGGIHFGVDLAAPCGTEVLAVADGLVFAVDGPFGSPPHNLMIDHPQLGYASMYGHLQQAPQLIPGQSVEQGQVVGYVGDSADDCNRAPHLHLEIRDLDHIRKYNPTNLIDANWHRLAMHGGSSLGFMRDLDEPRKWQALYEQPQAETGGPIINDFARTWPFDWEQADSTRVRRLPTSVPEAASAEEAAEPATLQQIDGARQITLGDCCTSFYWSEDSTEIRFIDQPAEAEPLGVWGVAVSQPENGSGLITDKLGYYNEERSLVAYPDRARGLVIIERVADGQTWEIDTNENSISFSPDGRILWTDYDAEVSWRARFTEIWMAETDGSNQQLVATLQRGRPVVWLPPDSVLVSTRIPPQQDTLLSKLSLEDGSLTELVQLPRVRGASFSPDRRFMAYMVRFYADSSQNGLWLVDLQVPNPEPEQLPFFGTYRWRDNENLIYIPFDPEAEYSEFYEYNVVTGETRQILPTDETSLPLAIANNEWRISPDGRQIALLAAQEDALDGIWVVDIE